MWFRIILHYCRKDILHKHPPNKTSNLEQIRLNCRMREKKRQMNRDEQKKYQEYQEYWSPPCGLCRYKSHSELLNQFYSLQQHINIQMSEGHKEGHRRSHPLEMITSKNLLSWTVWAEELARYWWRNGALGAASVKILLALLNQSLMRGVALTRAPWRHELTPKSAKLTGNDAKAGLEVPAQRNPIKNKKNKSSYCSKTKFSVGIKQLPQHYKSRFAPVDLKV